MFSLPVLGEGTLKAFSNQDVPAPFPAEHEPSGDDYFEDAVFIGDSMMEYVEIYELLPTAEFVWKIGMSPQGAMQRQFKQRGSANYLNALEIAETYKPRKIYVWLGANGLDFKREGQLLEDYERLADRLIETFDDALIYVISPPPMTKTRMENEDLRPGKYRTFEAMLRKLAGRRDFYYIDMYHMVVGEDGYLPRSYSMGDGFHLNETAYAMMVDTIRRLTVPIPGE